MTARATKVGFQVGARVRKKSGASWQGTVCGHYSTKLTPHGVCVESEREPGSVQIYPVAALEHVKCPWCELDGHCLDHPQGSR